MTELLTDVGIAEVINNACAMIPSSPISLIMPRAIIGPTINRTNINTYELDHLKLNLILAICAPNNINAIAIIASAI